MSVDAVGLWFVSACLLVGCWLRWHVDAPLSEFPRPVLAIAEGLDDDDVPFEPSDECVRPEGHEWVYTGTAYGGDDARYHGEGRCYCKHCGADGDA